jgi:hypothetical protein
MRLLSPQDFCQFIYFNQSQDQFGGNSNYFWFDGPHNQKCRFCCPIDPKSNLPIALAKKSTHTLPYSPFTKKNNTCCMKWSHYSSQHTSVCISLIVDQNQNLSSAQKELLLWHFRLGHLSFQHIQWLMRPQNFNSLSPI